MTRQMLSCHVKSSLAIVVLLFLSIAWVSDSPRASSQEKKDKTAPETETKTNEEIRREAEQVVGEIAMEILRDDKWIKVERIEKPLLFYGDPTRHNDRGSVWAWGRKGRPVALLELYRGETNRRMWIAVICNTSGGKLRARRAGAPWWRENDSTAELKDIPDAAVPAADSTRRQRQLKLLAQKFTAHEFWDPDNSRYELRLLKRPLCTYQDEANGLLDGGLFTLANGTNPEILLFVEARVDPENRSKRLWQYTVGRLAHAELHLEYDGKKVFEAPRGNRLSASNQPYWLSLINPARDTGLEPP